MMQGQRFHIDLDEALDGDLSSKCYDGSKAPAGFDLGLVGDIKERFTWTEPKVPSPPRLKSSETGFPAHKIRAGKSKYWREKDGLSTRTNDRAATDGLKPTSQPRTEVPFGNDTKNGSASGNGSVPTDMSIDQENKQRLAQMSSQEIEEARQELMANLSPSLIEKLLKKANIDEGRADARDESEPSGNSETERAKISDSSIPNAKPKKPPAIGSDGHHGTLSFDPDSAPLHPPQDLHPASSFPSSLPEPLNIHFPNPPRAPDLDPSDPNFLLALHEKYFPDLPADPSSLAWMSPLSSGAEADSAYSPSQASLPVSAVRFDFRGHLLPPRLAAQIPSTKGLHHHAHSPSSAGYTVPELSHLACSSYPAQRCIAYQTLGRILYRLGRGDFGQEGEDLCEGLWQLMEQEKIIDQLVAAAAKRDSGSRSIWVTATEAVWLWRKGGGRRWRGR